MLLSARHIDVWRGDTLLLDAVALSVGPGEVLQVIGRNGSGKTTLLRVLCGLVPMDEGEVYWCGEPLRRVRAEFQGSLLYLGHKPGICAGLTPGENLALSCALHGGKAAGIDAALDQLGLGERRHLLCGALSAGQQRRVALARLVLEPARLWVLDEPLTALDAAGLVWVGEQLVRHGRVGGTVIFTTHQALPLDGLVSRTLAIDSA